MSIEYTIDEAAGLITTRLSGHVDTHALRQLNSKVDSDPKAAACRRGLVDCSELTSIAADAMVVRELAMARSAPQRKVAIVAPSDASFGLARVFQGFASAEKSAGIEVFRDRDAALAWLMA